MSDVKFAPMPAILSSEIVPSKPSKLISLNEVDRLRKELDRAKDLLARAHAILELDESLKKLPAEIAEFLRPTQQSGTPNEGGNAQ